MEFLLLLLYFNVVCLKQTSPLVIPILDSPPEHVNNYITDMSNATGGLNLDGIVQHVKHYETNMSNAISSPSEAIPRTNDELSKSDSKSETIKSSNITTMENFFKSSMFYGLAAFVFVIIATGLVFFWVFYKKKTLKKIVTNYETTS